MIWEFPFAVHWKLECVCNRYQWCYMSFLKLLLLQITSAKRPFARKNLEPRDIATKNPKYLYDRKIRDRALLSQHSVQTWFQKAK